MKRFLNIIKEKAFILGILFLALSLQACKKLVEVDGPSTSLNEDLVYGSNETATAVLTDIYVRKMNDMYGGGLNSISFYAGLSADEFVLPSTSPDINYKSYFSNNLSVSSTRQQDFWTLLYSTIFVTNAAIEKIPQSSGISEEVKKQLLGEAKFLRAFHYFYLVNLFGGVPLNLTTDYKANSIRPRTNKEIVYDQIVLDLKDAKDLLSSDYKNAAMISVSERTRPNKFAAAALLSRIYLYRKDYLNAERESDFVLNNSAMYELVAVDDVFRKNSKETIWSIQPTGTDAFANTSEARFFKLTDITNPDDRIALRKSFVDQMGATDLRKNWISQFIDTEPDPDESYYFPFKYKIGLEGTSSEEYSIVLRLAEQYLIRAEARLFQSKFAQAKEDLNVIRKRAQASDITSVNQNEILDAISSERRIELFSEWGHRWMDLKRYGKANEVLKPLKGSDWQATDELYPIPKTELDFNINIRNNQNPGYGSN